MLVVKPPTIEQVGFDSPLEDTMQSVMSMTELRWAEWFENFAENLPLARNGLNLADLPLRQGPAIIVGAGPSVTALNHLEVLRKQRQRIPTLIATDRMLKPMLENGVRPDFVASLDSDRKVADFYKLDEYSGAQVDSVLNVVTTHPLTVKTAMKNLTGKIWWFSHLFDNPTDERCVTCNRLSLTAAAHFMSGKKMFLETGGNVGSFGWFLAHTLECSPIILTGMDLSYPADAPMEKTLYWNNLVKMHGDPETVRQKCFQIRENPDWGTRYLTDIMFEVYRKLLMKTVEIAGVPTINTCGGGAVYGKNVYAMSLEAAIETYCR